jgi:hypothetical protein
VGEVDGMRLAFVALERQGGVMTFDISNPHAPRFVDYANHRDYSGKPDRGHQTSRARSRSHTAALSRSYRFDNCMIQIDLPQRAKTSSRTSQTLSRDASCSLSQVCFLR